MEELIGTIEKITFFAEESTFAVASLLTHDKKKHSITGIMPGLQVGLEVLVRGQKKVHPKHGPQFEVDHFEFQLPKHKATIEKFLASGAIRGIGPVYASKIVQAFGNNTLDILDKNPERLLDVEGLGKIRADAIAKGWQVQKQLQDVIIFLHGFGVSRAFARRILKTYGANALQKIKENPYQLAKEVKGIGFKVADQIAKTAGFAHDFPSRITAGIDYLLYELSNSGHTCYPLNEFIKSAHELLQVDHTLISEQIGKQFQKGDIELKSLTNDTLYIWSKPLFHSEIGISNEIARLQHHASRLRSVDTVKAVAWAESMQKMTFAEQQRHAISQALIEKFSIITGGPGTGKSTITRAIVGITSKLTTKIILAAPTGRAAKRMSELTSHFASTLHRLLKFDFTTGKFKHDRDNPLDVDLLIIDEASMIDTYLLYQVLKAAPHTARVILIGDADQLPSVGPGNVLRDLIATEKLPSTQLKAIFRQAAGSQIIVNAHRINEGQIPYLTSNRESDFYFIEAKEPDEIRKKIINLVTEQIPQKFHFDPKKEIQVLSPMRKGPCGLEILNNELQNILTPGASFHNFRVGDKVMQLSNNYTKEVFNGDIGTIAAIDPDTELVTVNFDEKEVQYDVEDLDELTLAYAVSVHKYQGSESPCIIMPVHTVHFKLLTRNLLYTAVTRGRKLVVLVGTKKALAIAVKNQEIESRHTGLKALFNNFKKQLEISHEPTYTI